MRHATLLTFFGALAACVLGPAGLVAQSADRDLTQGIQAYRELEMESASWLLRRALADDGLSADDRKSALSYLGAAEFYRDRRDSALSAFGQLIELDPDYCLDDVVFPPDAQRAFEEARRRHPIVRVSARSGSFAPNGPGLPVRLDVNTPHVVVVTFESVNREVLDTVFRGQVTDDTLVRWSARGGRRAPKPVGGFLLGVSSLDAEGAVARRVAVPVEIRRTAEHSLALPEPPVMLPEHQSAGPAFVRLGLGIAAATTAYLVTPVFTDKSGPRVLLTGLFGAAGVIGFWEVRPGRPLPANVVANETARSAWRARVARIEALNRQRAVGGTVHVAVGKAR